MSGVNSNHSENQAIVSGRIDGTPQGGASVLAGKGFYIDGSATGVYVVTLDRAYQKCISLVATSQTAGVCVTGAVTALTAGTAGATFTFSSTTASSGSAVDADFSFIICLEVEDA